MSEAPSQHRRHTLLVALPTVILLLIIAGWSAFWFHAEHRANQVIDSWLARESAAGRQYTCADRSSGGYPFEIHVNCSEITVELPGRASPVVAKAAGFVGLAQVYDPRHIIVELKGPMTIGSAGAEPQVTLSWKLADASVVGSADSSDERLSVVLDKPVLHAAGPEGAALASADRVELHARRDPEDSKTYIVLAHAAQIVAPQTEAWFGGALTAELQVAVSGVDNIPRASVSDLLHRFADADGKLDVALIRLTAPDIAAEARGTVSLDAAGRPEGSLIVTGRAASALLDNVFAGSNADMVRFGLSLLGQPAVLGGKPASRVEVDARNGKLRIGPIKVGAIPSLYRLLPPDASAAGNAP